MVIFNRYFSGFYFNIVRTIATIPLVPFLLVCNSCLAQSQDEFFDENSEEEIDTQGHTITPLGGSIRRQTQERESWCCARNSETQRVSLPCPTLSLFPSMPPEQNVHPLPSNRDASAPDIIKLQNLHPKKWITGEVKNALSSSKIGIISGNTEGQKNEKTWIFRCRESCTKNKKMRDGFAAAFCSLSSLSQYKLHPNAVWPVAISTVSGCVRQMIVPIALMFTTATAGSFSVIRFPLEKGVPLLSFLSWYYTASSACF